MTRDVFAWYAAAALALVCMFALCNVRPAVAADDEAELRLAWVKQATANNTPTTEVEFVKHVVRTQAIAAGANPADALNVSWCESKWNPQARNGQYQGLFQLGDYHRARAASLGYSWADMLRPLPNARTAMDLWASSGWQPWSCKP